MLGEALLSFLHHHLHHAVVLPEDSSCYFTIARWIEEVKASSSRTCVERGGAVRSALDRIFRDLNRREYDSINRVLATLPLSDLQGYVDPTLPS